jgi:hypothetical protein
MTQEAWVWAPLILFVLFIAICEWLARRWKP